MMRKLFPLLLALIGLGAGIAGGLAFKPATEPAVEVAEVEIDPDMLPEYVKMNNQFVIPILEDGRVAAMVILSLSLEVEKGATEEVYSREPKLRDAFLQVMFDHANTGGFKGSFTDGSNMILLRTALQEMAKKTLGDIISDVLISDIVRQDS